MITTAARVRSAASRPAVRWPATGVAMVLVVASAMQPAVASPVVEPHLGSSPPGQTPELFAPWVVSTDAVELNSMFTPDGRYFFFSRRREDPPGSGWPNVVAGDVCWVDAVVIENLRPNRARDAR